MSLLPKSQKRKLTTKTRNLRHPKHPRKDILVSFFCTLCAHDVISLTRGGPRAITLALVNVRTKLSDFCRRLVLGLGKKWALLDFFFSLLRALRARYSTHHSLVKIGASEKCWAGSNTAFAPLRFLTFLQEGDREKGLIFKSFHFSQQLGKSLVCQILVFTASAALGISSRK